VSTKNQGYVLVNSMCINDKNLEKLMKKAKDLVDSGITEDAKVVEDKSSYMLYKKIETEKAVDISKLKIKFNVVRKYGHSR